MVAVMLGVGDLILDEPDAASFLEPSKRLLTGGDVVIGNVEVPHTDRGADAGTYVGAPPADPSNLDALAEAGFTVATLAGNHIHDAGPNGIHDTVARLRRLGIATCGAGANLDDAREPAVIEANGVRVGVLAYNCVGPSEGWATSGRPGCAYVKIITHYELDHANPGGPPRIYSFVAPESGEAMARGVAALREHVDVVVVAFHKGLVHRPAELAMYERPVAHLAVEAGADIVLAHHAHVLRGIEFHRGTPIFHGLGNFVTVTRALTPDEENAPERREWAQRREELFGFSPDPAMLPTYPFHPESRNTMIARCTFGTDGVHEAGFIPVHIDARARPQPLTEHDATPVISYVTEITARAGLNTEYHVGEQMVTATPG